MNTKKTLKAMALVVLICTGIVLIYLDALAVDLPCDQAEIWCEIDCAGSFSIDYCWDSEQHTYCYFYCYFSGYCYHWGDWSPVYAICTLTR